MNTQTDAVPNFPLESQAVAPVAISPARRMFWSVRREIWENRSIYIAPFAVAAVFLLGFLVTAIQLPGKIREISTLDPARQHHALVAPYDIVAALLMLTAIVVAAFYCVDAFHSERRDRSILFWKSVPVSDLSTVLAKASIPLLVLPLLAFATVVAVQLIMLLVSTLVLVGSGLNPAVLWVQLSPLRMWLMLLYHLLTVHAISPAPIYCWLLLVSAWARRAVVIWAVLPLVMIAGLERIIFHTSHFAVMVGTRFSGTGNEAFTPHGAFPTDPMTHLTPIRFLGSPDLWLGILISAVFLAVAVRLRRSRGPI